VASIALHGLVTGAGIQATVLGMSSHAVWLAVEDRVVVVATNDTARLPNGIQIPVDSTSDAFADVRHGATVEVGHARVMLEGLAVTIGRWWDPRPTLSPTTHEELSVALAGLPNDVPDINSSQLYGALVARSAGGILHASRSLLGKGPGLTPEGDDYLAGALAAMRLLGEALGREQIVSLIAGISVPLARLTEARTTTFSAALIQSALRGQVAEPAGALLRALAGRGDIPASHLGLIRVGHSSGPALAAGIVLGAQSLVASGTNSRT
jgi:hypothetical protein